MSKGRNAFDTEAEAQAFCSGVNYVQDIDVDTEGPIQEANEYVVYVIIGGDDEELEEAVEGNPDV